MESITDWAFSWPISSSLSVYGVVCGGMGDTHADSSLPHCVDGFVRCYAPCARSWSRASSRRRSSRLGGKVSR